MLLSDSEVHDYDERKKAGHWFSIPPCLTYSQIVDISLHLMVSDIAVATMSYLPLWNYEVISRLAYASWTTDHT